MRMSALFNRTRREVPTDVDVAGHQLLIRAGYIAPLAAGIFSYLPLAQRSIHKISQIVRSEINGIGGQEVTLPIVQPDDLWQESRGLGLADKGTTHFQDINGHGMVLAISHAEAVAGLVRNIVHSYRQLPALIYDVQTRWRDDARSRTGMIRAREFSILESYSLDVNEPGLEIQYQAHFQAFSNVYKRLQLPVTAVQSDVGMFGGLKAQEFVYLTAIGEDTLLFCDHCGYAANRQVARFNKPRPPEEIPLPLKKIATPHTTTIESLADILHIPSSKTAKAVFLMANPIKSISDKTEIEQFVFVVVRGDMEVSESKLANAIKARALRPATEAEIRTTGTVPGYASPLGLKNVLVIVDDLLADCPNLVAGANEEGYHLLNVNFVRDYQASLITDIALAQAGDRCPICNTNLRSNRGVQIGHLFQMGVTQSAALGSAFLDETSQSRPVIMGNYSLEISRLLACIAEEHHDPRGLCWPISIAPYVVQLVLLGSKDGSTETTAQTLYNDLSFAGVEVLFDDRTESAGVKFNDADLIGLPLRLTVGERNLKQGKVELKHRTDEQGIVLPLEEAVGRVIAEILELEEKLKS